MGLVDGNLRRQERGRVKFKYHRRRHVWNVVACLVNGGVSADVALVDIRSIWGGMIFSHINDQPDDSGQATADPSPYTNGLNLHL